MHYQGHLSFSKGHRPDNMPALAHCLANVWCNVNPMLVSVINLFLAQPLHVHRGDDGPTIGIQDWDNADPMLTQPLASDIGPMQIQHRPNQSIDWLPWLDERWIYIGPMMEANGWVNMGPVLALSWKPMFR